MSDEIMSGCISCIVPVYNGARFLAEALDSILAQSRPPSEIIVVDDGSTDATPEVAARYADQVRYVHQVNKGPAAARNRGLELARGDFLSFLDADDLWHSHKLEKQMQVLALDTAAGICLTHVQNFWIEELAAERERLRDHPFAKPKVGYVCQALLARRSVFERVGEFDESKRIGEDTDWFLRVDAAGIGKHVLPDILVQRRIHGANISYEIYESKQAREDLIDNVQRYIRQRRARAS